MASKCKINRKTVRGIIRDYDGLGATTMEACASFVVSYLGLELTCRNKAQEILEALANAGEVIFDNDILRLATIEEKEDAHRAAAQRKHQRRAIRRRTEAKRHGGLRRLPVRTARPLPATLAA